MTNFFTSMRDGLKQGLTANLFGRYNGAGLPGASVESMEGTLAGRVLGNSMNGYQQNTPANGGSLPKIDENGVEDMGRTSSDLSTSEALGEAALSTASMDKPNSSTQNFFSGLGAILSNYSSGMGHSSDKEQKLTVFPVFQRTYTPTFLGGRYNG